MNLCIDHTLFTTMNPYWITDLRFQTTNASEHYKENLGNLEFDDGLLGTTPKA